ncbi:MAG: hypothetical protein AAB497_03365 [Patescibacteria group bacterium]
MSFSSSGVTFNRTKWIRNRIFKFLFKGAEGILSVLFVISLAAPMIFPKDVNAALGVSSKLSYQGRLTNNTGDPYSGTYYVCFSIFDASTAGTKLWPTAVPTSNTVTVTNGVFDVGIGVANALDFDFSTNDTVYLNVGVSASNVTCDNGAMENLTPRQRMDATPYARVAANVWGTALRTNATSTSIGAGSGAATPIWLNLDWKNTATTLGGACPSGSVNGSVWYNSSGTRALACINNIVVGIDNTNEITGIKEQSAGSPITAGAVNFSGSNNITISQTGSTLQFSVPTPVQGFGMSNIGNTLGTSGSGTGTIVLAGGNNITLSQATGAGARTITIIGPAAGGGAALQGSGTYSQNTGTVQFGNSNGITFGLSNNGTMTASHNGLTIQSAQPVAISGSNGSFVFSTVSFGNLNGLSFYTSNGSIVGSYTAGGGGGAALQGSGTYSQNTGTVQFGNSNGITFGLSNNGVMTASHNGLTTAMASNAGSNFLAATGGFSGTNISGTILSNGLQMSVAAPGGGAAIPLNFYQNLSGTAGMAGLAFTGSHKSLFVFPLNNFQGFPGDITANTMYLNLSQSGSTATMSLAFTSNFYLGVYTLNTGVSSLSLLNSVNASFAKNPAATNNSTAFVGPRFFSIHSSQWSSQPVFKQGSQYFVGWFWSSAGALNQTVSLFGFSQYSTAQRSNMIGTSGTATSQGWAPFYGVYTATTGAMPTAINNSQFKKVTAGGPFVPHIIFNASNVTNF